MKKVIIIGAGASGLACAVSIKKNHPDSHVVLIEKNEKIGKKILVTGNGRCNLSNDHMDIQYYHGNGIEMFYPTIQDFNCKEFFHDLGLLTCNIDELVYPLSKQASSVVDIFQQTLDYYQIEIRTSFEVIDIKKENNFIVLSKDEKIKGDILVLATGGKAYDKQPYLGYQLSTTLGHQMTDIYPSLVQIETKEVYKELKGQRLACTVSFVCEDKEIKKETGEVLFTDYGLSGIAVMQLSRLVHTYSNGKIVLDCMPDYSFKELHDFLTDRKKKYMNRSIQDFASGLFLKPLFLIILKQNHMTKVKDINIDLLTKQIKMFTFTITKTKSFLNAQVCAGGISLKEIHSSFESKIVNNLYCIGEILDIDGDCGGYNLHYAYASGHKAGIEISRRMKEEG